jgi:hypothetical protein
MSSLSIVSFAVQDASQGLAARGATETLGRQRRRDGKPLVAAGSLTGSGWKILRKCCWALALASGRGVRRGWSRWVRRSRSRHGQRRLGENGQGEEPAIALALLAATGLALFTGPPGAAGMTATPALGFASAGVAAVPALGVAGPIGAFAAFEQAMTAAKRRRGRSGLLCGWAANVILKRSQGSWRSRRSSLGGELIAALRDALLMSERLSRITAMGRGYQKGNRVRAVGQESDRNKQAVGRCSGRDRQTSAWLGAGRENGLLPGRC